MDNVEYRDAYAIEIEQIALLHNELTYFIQKETNDGYWDFEKLSTYDTIQFLTEFIQDEHCKIKVAVISGNIVGFIMGEIVKCHLPISNVKEVGYIAAAYVTEQYRRRGIMSRLEEEISSYFKSCGVKYIEVNFLTNNDAAKKFWTQNYKIFREQARKIID